MNNIDPETGVAYGYVSADALDPEIVNALMDGAGKAYRNHDQEAYEKAYREEHGIGEDEDLPDDAYDDYEPYEESVEGIFEGVTYASSWLGGALNFFILDSPVVTTRARRASPCVPGAGILDALEGDVTAYNLPSHWRPEGWFDHSAPIAHLKRAEGFLRAYLDAVDNGEPISRRNELDPRDIHDDICNALDAMKPGWDKEGV